MNKYHVRALRDELEGYARNRQWNRLRSRLTALTSAPTTTATSSLLRAVVAPSSHSSRKKGQGRSTGSSSRSLLHTVLSLHSTTTQRLQQQDPSSSFSSSMDTTTLSQLTEILVPYVVFATTTSTTTPVPKRRPTRSATKATKPPALLLDKRGQTVLHVALERGHSVRIVQIILRQIEQLDRASAETTLPPWSVSRNIGHHPLLHADQNGNTPLLLAVRQCPPGEDKNGYVEGLLLSPSLLSRESPPQSEKASQPADKVENSGDDRTVVVRLQQTLIGCPSRKRPLPVWNAVTQEYKTAHNTHDNDDDDNNTYEIPDHLELLLVATACALRLEMTTPTSKDVDDFPLRPLETWKTFVQKWQSYETINFDRNSEMKDMVYYQTVIWAFITCAPLLEKYAVRYMAWICNSSVYKSALLSRSFADCGDDHNGISNNILHLIARAVSLSSTANMSWYDRTGAAVIYSLLWEQIVQNLSHHNQKHPEEGELVLSYLSQPNAQGNFPLHLVSAAPTASKNLAWMQSLVEAYPGALQHYNHDGAVPLHLALLTRSCGCCSATLNDENGNNTNDEDDDDNRMLWIDFLWRTAPSTLKLRHGPTHLYPFALAAARLQDCKNSSRSSSINDKKKEFEGKELSFIYNLVLAAPEVLAMSSAAASEMCEGS